MLSSPQQVGVDPRSHPSHGPCVLVPQARPCPVIGQGRISLSGPQMVRDLAEKPVGPWVDAQSRRPQEGCRASGFTPPRASSICPLGCILTLSDGLAGGLEGCQSIASLRRRGARLLWNIRHADGPGGWLQWWWRDLELRTGRHLRVQGVSWKLRLKLDLDSDGKETRPSSLRFYSED